MATLDAVNWYICANVLLLVATALLAGFRAFSAALPQPIPYRQQLKLSHALSAAAVLLPALGALRGGQDFLAQTAQVWSAPTMQAGAVDALADHRIAVAISPAGASASLLIVSRAAAGLFLAGLLIALTRLALDAATTVRVIAGAQIIRRCGRLRILASEHIQIPFSFWLPARYFIVVPSTLLVRSDHLRLAIRHEAQHHRQQDTKALYLYQLLKAAFFWNPAVHALERRIMELQEFACDEALAVHPKTSVQAYCQCLLSLAEAAAPSSCARTRTSMIGAAGALLKRRIEAMLMHPTSYSRKSVVLAAAGLAFALMAVTTSAFTTTIQDRRVSAEEAYRMAAVARQDSNFPIVVNERVLEQLNLLLGTPDGRAHLRAGLARMQDHEALISEHIARYAMPTELLAVPLVESGYRNLPQANPRHGAGLWQFIKPTAERFGLKVDESGDERLDVRAETDAAMRYLTRLHLQFNDWALALLAYNAGAWRVEKGIRETGSRDAWEITRQGYENDLNYLPRVMAAILIVKNPAALQ